MCLFPFLKFFLHCLLLIKLPVCYFSRVLMKVRCLASPGISSAMQLLSRQDQCQDEVNLAAWMISPFWQTKQDRIQVQLESGLEYSQIKRLSVFRHARLYGACHAADEWERTAFIINQLWPIQKVIQDKNFNGKLWKEICKHSYDKVIWTRLYNSESAHKKMCHFFNSLKEF